MSFDSFMEKENYKYPETGIEPGKLSLAELWQSIWDFKWWCLASIVICLLLAGLYIYRKPAVYTRTAKIIVDENGQSSALKDITSFSNTLYRRNTFTSGVNVYNEVEALATPDLMEMVVYKLGLETSYSEIQFLRTVPLDDNKPVQMDILESDVHGSFSFIVNKTGADSFTLDHFTINGKKCKCPAVNGHLSDTLDTQVGRIILYPAGGINKWENDVLVTWANARSQAKAYNGALSVNVANKQNSVVVLRTSNYYAKKAENILSTLIDSYNNQWIENANKTANNTTRFIDDRLVVIEQELSEIETTLKDFKEEHKIADVRSEAQLYITQVGDLAEKNFEVSNQLSIVRYLREYLTNPANASALIPANTGLKNTSAELQITEYNKIMLNRDILIGNSSASNPLIADMNMTLDSMRSAILRSLDNMISSLSIQADKIKTQEDRLLSRISSNTGEELQLIGIQRQQKVKESLYVFLLQKREENELASMVNVANTRIIQAPTGGGASSRSHLIILIAIIIGISLPVGFVALKRSLDNKVRRKDDLEGMTIPFLAEIPLLKKGKGEMERQIIVKADSRDSMNEAYRVLRTNIDLMAGRENKVFLFTSFTPGSGKTFSVMNVAQSMAIKGSRTLLIDLDLRKGSLSQALHKSQSGVSTWLSGKDNDIEKLIVPISERLDLIPAGILPPNPAELLLTDQYEQMINYVKERYDYVFLDCPPIDIVADTAIIARKADITIFTIRAGMFEKQDLPLIENLYRNEKYPHMALVLNGIDYANKLYGGYGYHLYGKYGMAKYHQE